MHFVIVAALAFAPIATCYPPAVNHDWKPPGPTDRRSPCPMLNALANHGFLPRNGFNVSITQIVDGFAEALHLAKNSTLPVAQLAQTTSTTGNANTFHLNDLNKHGVIEHDGSLSRNDVLFGDNHSFNPAIWNTVAVKFTKSTISIATAAAARKSRLAAAKAANPKFQFGDQENQFSLFETSLYLRVFGQGTSGNAVTRWVNILFREERLPYREGFSRSAAEITNDEIVELADKVAAA